MKKLLLCLISFSPIFSIFTSAQNLQGIWKGHFFGDDGEQYNYEVQLQHIKNSISGITYAFQDKSFYGKAIFNGNFNPATKAVFLQEIKTIEIKLGDSDHACIQTCTLTYVKSGKEEFLEGTYTSTIEKTDTINETIKGSDCGNGKMTLRKVVSSNFEMEPFLLAKPVVTNPIISTEKNKPTPKTTTDVRPKIAPVQKIESSIAKPTIKTPIVTTIPFQLKYRKNILHETLTISSKDVTIKLYDNGEVDDDSVSVYLNNKLMLSKKRLTKNALTISFTLDESIAEHELVIAAENLGKIPPNTALMIVNAGEQRFEIRISSTEQNNALLKFKYVPLKNQK